MSTSNPLTRERIEAEPWIGDQRSQVMALLEERDAVIAALISRDLVERAFEELAAVVEAGEDLGNVERAHLFLKEALGR